MTPYSVMTRARPGNGRPIDGVLPNHGQHDLGLPVTHRIARDSTRSRLAWDLFLYWTCVGAPFAAYAIVCLGGTTTIILASDSEGAVGTLSRARFISAINRG